MNEDALAPVDEPKRLPLLVPRAGRRPLIIRLRSLGAETHFYEDATVLAIVDDVDRRDQKSAEILMHLFGLTPGQVRIAALIGSRQTIAQCARQLRVDVEAVRSALSKVFEKTGVNRQADLVRIVAYLPSL